MVDLDAAESPLAAAAGAAGPHATEAFALLGNETRLAILLALWEEYDPHGGENVVPFSRIFEQVDYDDPGNLRYHLEKLEGQFIRQRAEREGYELREIGLELVQSVIAGAGVEDAELEATEIDEPCPLCGAPTLLGYHDGLVIHACTECEGPTPEATETEGFLSATPFDPVGLVDRTPEDLRTASKVVAWVQVRGFYNGICPACSGSVDAWIECCTDHDSTGGCEHCGREFGAWARFQCRVCKNHSVASPKSLALFHPAVVSFYDDHGVRIRVHANDFEAAKRVVELMDDHGMDVVSGEPPLVSVSASLDGEAVSVTFDETVTVVDVRR